MGILAVRDRNLTPSTCPRHLGHVPVESTACSLNFDWATHLFRVPLIVNIPHFLLLIIAEAFSHLSGESLTSGSGLYGIDVSSYQLTQRNGKNFHLDTGCRRSLPRISRFGESLTFDVSYDSVNRDGIDIPDMLWSTLANLNQ